jgi:prepilin-type N-terminal cleavage/methylation domain-containing protein
MNISNKPKTQGFTIIEVVLVLAIAGLIFLIVFLALPALQRSQRDTQRKNDLSRLMSQLTQYQSNHQGSTPSGNGNGATQWGGFVTAYLTNNGQTFNDPSTGSTYSVTEQSVFTTLPTNNGDLFLYMSANCNGGTLTAVSPTNNRSVAGLVKLEQGGTLCQNN